MTTLEFSPTNNSAESGKREDGALVFHHPPKFAWTSDRTQEVPLSFTDYHLYVHVPFCRKICTFCTFERKQLRHGSLERFVSNVNRELDTVSERGSFLKSNAHSVYFGGGTASLMAVDALSGLVSRFQSQFGLKDAEVTLECEPGTKKLADFKQLRRVGFNRISIGLQSLQDHHLKNLNRSHNSAQAIAMVEDVQQAGFDNVHVDLMYALPGQTLDEWSATLDGVVRLGVSHISAYHLIVFQHELLDRKIGAKGSNAIPELSVINEMRQMLYERMKRAGFVRYSLTEFGKPGCQCEYVKSNWNGADYLGFGPGAYSRNGRWLWENDVIHVRYDEKVASSQLPIGRGHLMADRTALIRDATMGLCLLELNLDAIQKKHSAQYSDTFWALVDELVGSGFLFRDAQNVKLTSSGIRHATHVMKRITDLDLV